MADSDATEDFSSATALPAADNKRRLKKRQTGMKGTVKYPAEVCLGDLTGQLDRRPKALIDLPKKALLVKSS